MILVSSQSEGVMEPESEGERRETTREETERQGTLLLGGLERFDGN